MTQPLSPTSLVLPLPVEAWVERHGNDRLIRWTPDEPLMGLTAGSDPEAIDEPLPATIDAAGKRATVAGPPGEGRVYYALDFGRRRLITAERALPLPSGVNFRDVGGYRTADGRAVRWGQLYRAGSLADLTDADVAALGALGLRLACDLRSADELARHADRLPPGATHAHRPIVGEVGRLRRVVTFYRKRHRVQELLEEVYRVMLDQNGPVFAGVLRLAADPANRPLVIHCTAGKDRTGLAVALLLLTLGVPEETVVADYTLSNHAFEVLATRMRPEMARLYSLGFGEVQLRPFLLAEARTLRGALAYLRQRYGGVDAYLRRGGLTDEIVAALRRQLLWLEEPR
ncbi:MAG: tyrosine-protein phosphatase [Candidatus Promineofilum sp.]|nr:tyrosine-protein phosphatase [Promineifilum sp.]